MNEKESIFKNKKVQLAIRLITALSFMLFTFYQIILAIFSDASKVGRLIGVVFYLLITVAAYFDISEKFGLWVAHLVLLVIGLTALFVTRLLNIPAIFGALDFSKLPTVLNCALYILTQLGTLVLIMSFLMLKADLTRRQMQKLINILMTIVIVIYTICFVLECVLILKYRMNIDSIRIVTLFSRVLYLLGYVGTAVSLMLPAPTGETDTKLGQFLYLNEEEEEEVDLVI